MSTDNQTMQIINQNCKIIYQINGNGDITINDGITIHNHGPQPFRPDLSTPIDFHLPRPISSFRGREAELQWLSSWMCSGRRRAVISGLPGYGKTELAKQFAWRCRAEHGVQHVLWMNAETPDTLMADFTSLARLIGMPDVDDETTVQMVYKYFAQTSSIFVFDNAATRSTICEFEPAIDYSTFLLMTSLVLDWDDDCASLALGPLSPGAALDVLQAELEARYHPGHDALYADLVDVIGCVPRQLQVAAARLRQDMVLLRNEFSLHEFVEEMKEKNGEDEDGEKGFPEFSDNLYRRKRHSDCG